MKHKPNDLSAGKSARIPTGKKNTAQPPPPLGSRAPRLRGFDSLPDAARVAAFVVAELYGVGIATVWRWERDGLLPPPERIGRVTRWRVGDLRSHHFNEAA